MPINPRMVLRSAITASSSGTSGQTASNLPVVYGARVVTCTRNALRKKIHLPSEHASTAGWRKEKKPTSQLSGLQICGGGDAEKKVTENTQNYNTKDVLLKPRHHRCVLRGGAPRQDRGTAAASDMSGSGGSSSHNRTEDP
jgi:hypothetical protein